MLEFYCITAEEICIKRQILHVDSNFRSYREIVEINDMRVRCSAIVIATLLDPEFPCGNNRYLDLLRNTHGCMCRHMS